MKAEEIMSQLNSSALASEENGLKVFVEDIQDPDGRWYRVEYRCRADGSGANAWCLYNPWGSNPYNYRESHLSSDGLLCLGTATHSSASPYSIDYVVARSRFWCTGYSFLREHGYSATCRAIPEWGHA
jgi:hypothetical protein